MKKIVLDNSVAMRWLLESPKVIRSTIRDIGTSIAHRE